MVATQTQLRRGTESQCDAMTPVEAEPIVDLTNDRIRIGDGVVMGGIPLPNAYDTQMMAFNFAVASGTGNAITLTLPLVPTYGQPLTIKFRASNNNTGATTIDVNSLGAKNILKVSSGALVALAAGDIISGVHYEISYDGVQFQLTTLYSSVGSLVKQGNLDTSQSTFSSVSSNQIGTTGIYYSGTSLTTPGGQYGFSIETNNLAGAGLFGWWLASSYVAGAYLSGAISWNNVGSDQTTYGRQRYVNSSPPFDMGDGEVGGFIFLLLNSSGEIASHYAADVPPWAYNGPTNIRADYTCPLTKKKYRTVQKKSLDDIMSGAKAEYVRLEITNEMKNKDMKLIPHPFGKIPPGHRVVLLDPMSDKTQRLIDFQNNGGSDMVIEAIRNGHIKIDSDPIARKCPKSVQACKFTYKST